MYVVESSSPSTCLSEEVLLAGFRDCKDEVLHFLTNVEQLPQQDPLIQGLLQHLDGMGKDVAPMGAAQPRADPAAVTGTFPVFEPVFQLEGLDFDPNMAVRQVGSVVFVDNAPTFIPCRVPSQSPRPDSSQTTLPQTVGWPHASPCPSQAQDSISDPTPVSQMDIEDCASDLTHLASNNPQIGDLLSELFELLEEDDEDNALGCTSEDESSCIEMDSGFLEEDEI